MGEIISICCAEYEVAGGDPDYQKNQRDVECWPARNKTSRDHWVSFAYPPFAGMCQNV